MIPTRTLRRAALHAAAATTVLFATSCFERQLAPVDPCTRSVVGEDIRVEGIDELDLLFMIDSSPTMAEEQEAIRMQIPRLVSILTTGDLEAGTAGAGMRDFAPVRSMHIGVITQDGGGLGRSSASICASVAGDDGLLSMPQANTRRVAMAGCDPASIPEFLEFESGVTNTTMLTDAFTCQTRLGTGGCGYEQPLEMILKAVADASYVPPTGPYLSGTPAHGGGGDNAGFLRDNSVLAVVIVTDEDDGSVSNSDLFDESITTFTPNDPNIRAAFNPGYLYDVQRYVEGLRAAVPDPDRLVVISIVGVPVDLVDDVMAGEGERNLTAVLADSRMAVVQDTTRSGYLLSACDSATGEAYPARRIVDFTQRVGGVVQSICQSDFGPAIDVLVRRIANALGGACLPRELNPDADGNVPCDVLQVLPANTPHSHCSDLTNPEAFELVRTETSVDGAGNLIEREVCRVQQVGRAGAGTTPGWVYDDGTLGSFSSLPAGCTQRIAFSALTPVTGANIRLECFQTILPGSGGSVQIGSFCDPTTQLINGSTTLHCADGHAVAGNPMTLSCDAFDRTCQIPCAADSDCVAAGLLSYVCDNRPASEYFGMATLPTGVSGDTIHHFCVNPTCN